MQPILPATTECLLCHKTTNEPPYYEEESDDDESDDELSDSMRWILFQSHLGWVTRKGPRVIVISKEGRAHVAAPILILVWLFFFFLKSRLVWQRLRTLEAFSHDAAHLVFRFTQKPWHLIAHTQTNQFGNILHGTIFHVSAIECWLYVQNRRPNGFLPKSLLKYTPFTLSVPF